MSRGGNAVDAAIATMLCDGALCPEYMGLGGGFLMSVYNATTKKVISINARESAPAAADEHMFSKDPKASVVGKCLAVDLKYGVESRTIVNDSCLRTDVGFFQPGKIDKTLVLEYDINIYHWRFYKFALLFLLFSPLRFNPGA